MTDTRNQRSRDLPLDFVKGLLVIFMVVYHVMNYFSTAGPKEFGYVRFVSGSFIFISGYIISVFYEHRYWLDRASVSRRLFMRGVKLLLLFTALNLLIHGTGVANLRKPSINLEQYFAHLPSVYFSGNRTFAAFVILMPISYLLMASPFFLRLSRFGSVPTLLVALTALSFSLLDIGGDNVHLAILGLVGFSVGITINRSKRLRSFHVTQRGIVLGLLVVTIYVMGYLDRNTVTYSLGIMIVLKLFYDLARMADLGKKLNRAIIQLGQYSLACYILQILFLQALFRMMASPRWGLGFQTFSVFMLTTIFLIASCGCLTWLRCRSSSNDKSYHLLFS